MAVSIDYNVSNSGSGISLSASLQIDLATDMVVVLVGRQTSNLNTGLTATYNSVSMAGQVVKTHGSDSGFRSAIFALGRSSLPSPGTYSATINMVDTGLIVMHCYAISGLKDQGAEVSSVVESYNNSVTPLTAGAYIIGMMHVKDNGFAFTATGVQTKLHELGTGVNADVATGDYISETIAARAFNWTYGSSPTLFQNLMVAFEAKPEAGGRIVIAKRGIR